MNSFSGAKELNKFSELSVFELLRLTTVSDYNLFLANIKEKWILNYTAICIMIGFKFVGKYIFHEKKIVRLV